MYICYTISLCIIKIFYRLNCNYVRNLYKLSAKSQSVNKKWKYVTGVIRAYVDPYHAKLIYLNFHPLKVASRCCDPQLQVAENYSYLFNLSTNICQSQCLDTHSRPNNSNLVDK